MKRMYKGLFFGLIFVFLVLCGCGTGRDALRSGDVVSSENSVSSVEDASSKDSMSAGDDASSKNSVAAGEDASSKAALSAGNDVSSEESFSAGGRKLRVVAAVFPGWDWCRNVLGDNPAGMELSLLVDNGVDLHSYQPSVDDILTIATADLFIYVGGESDEWVTNALKQANNPDMRILKMLDAVGEAAQFEETVDGMQPETDEDEEETAEYDEHVWLSLRNVEAVTEAICRELSAIDPEHAAVYEKNAADYAAKLDALDRAYSEMVEKAPLHTLLFGDRFPFRYLTEDYGLDYYAAFSGCSAETEASFETIMFLAHKVDELGLGTVLTIDGGDKRIAETIVQNTAGKNQQILTLDSIQSVSSKDIEEGITYLSIMESNLNILQQALEG